MEFRGLTLVLDLSGTPADGMGITHALAASVCFTALLLLSDKVRGGGDSPPVTLHMPVVGIGAHALVCAITGAFTLPTTVSGWVRLVGCPLFYSFAFIALFEAVRMAGPMRAALMFNVEPVASALLGYALLGQVPSGWQVAGMALVVGAVVSARLPAVMRSQEHALDRRTVSLLISGLVLLLAALAVLP